MTRDPFLRLALIAACSLYLVGVGVVDRMLGWPVALCALVGGVAGSLLLTLELAPEPEDGEPERHRRFRRHGHGTQGFERLP